VKFHLIPPGLQHLHSVLWLAQATGVLLNERLSTPRLIVGSTQIPADRRVAAATTLSGEPGL
jgi:hypothetical protein